MATKKAARTPDATYAERLEYARWVRGLTTDSPEYWSDMWIWMTAGVKQSWFSKWKHSEEAPPGHKELTAVASALGVPLGFLAGHAGVNAPLPGLFHDWMWARRGVPVEATDPRYGGVATLPTGRVGAKRERKPAPESVNQKRDRKTGSG